MEPIDWVSIKTEYITTDISQRDLADKYGVSLMSVNRHSRAEGWMEARENYVNGVYARCLQKATEKQADKFTRFLNSVDKLQAKIDQLLELEDALSPRDLKSLSSALMDAKELYGFKEEEKSEASDAVSVSFGPEMEEYCN